MSSRFRNEAVDDYGADYMVWFSTFNSILVYNYFVTFTNPNPYTNREFRMQLGEFTIEEDTRLLQDRSLHPNCNPNPDLNTDPNRNPYPDPGLDPDPDPTQDSTLTRNMRSAIVYRKTRKQLVQDAMNTIAEVWRTAV